MGSLEHKLINNAANPDGPTNKLHLGVWRVLEDEVVLVEF